jgi:hypothetical protein
MNVVEPRVDRGQVIYLTTTFAGDPDEVYFAFLAPGTGRPIVDDGYGQPKSRIVRISEGVYQFAIDTTNMKAGECWWHAWSVGNYQASEFGRFFVNSAPIQLL